MTDPVLTTHGFVNLGKERNCVPIGAFPQSSTDPNQGQRASLSGTQGGKFILHCKISSPHGSGSARSLRPRAVRWQANEFLDLLVRIGNLRSLLPCPPRRPESRASGEFFAQRNIRFPTHKTYLPQEDTERAQRNEERRVTVRKPVPPHFAAIDHQGWKGFYPGSFSCSCHSSVASVSSCAKTH